VQHLFAQVIVSRRLSGKYAHASQFFAPSLFSWPTPNPPGTTTSIEPANFVSGRSKPASQGRIKTSQFEGIIIG
jgi:hypothetical protein